MCSVLLSQLFLYLYVFYFITRFVWRSQGALATSRPLCSATGNRHHIQCVYISVQKHTSESTVEDRELATTILRYYLGEVEDLGPHTVLHFSNFTQMLDDSFFLFATHRSSWYPRLCLPSTWTGSLTSIFLAALEILISTRTHTM